MMAPLERPEYLLLAAALVACLVVRCWPSRPAVR